MKFEEYRTVEYVLSIDEEELNSLLFLLNKFVNMVERNHAIEFTVDEIETHQESIIEMQNAINDYW